MDDKTEDKKTLKSEYQNGLTAYLIDKASNHNYYKIYSNILYIESWLNDKSLYLSDGSRWNDKNDSQNLQKCKDIIRFALCTSFSVSENAAMWMLYSGMNKNGAMLNIKKGQMNDIITKAENIRLGSFGKSGFECKLKIFKDNFNIYRHDILYYSDKLSKSGSKGQKGYAIKRSDERVSVEDYNCYRNSPMAKTYPWCYENECRIVVEVDSSVLKGLADPNEIHNVAIQIPEDICEKLKKQVILAPNFESSASRSGLQTEKSDLTGKIDWDLCEKCSLKDKIKNDYSVGGCIYED